MARRADPLAAYHKAKSDAIDQIMGLAWETFDGFKLARNVSAESLRISARYFGAELPPDITGTIAWLVYTRFEGIEPNTLPADLPDLGGVSLITCGPVKADDEIFVQRAMARLAAVWPLIRTASNPA